jgi:hypothetical protein
MDELVPPGFLYALDRPEWKFLFQERLWTTGPITVAANVGNVSFVEVVNLAKNLIVVVTEAKVVAPLSGAIFSLRLNGAAGGAPAQNVARDTRQLVGVQSLNRLANNVVGVSGIEYDQVEGFGLNAQVAEFTVLPIILGPNPPLGNRLAIFNIQQNQALIAILSGYEYNCRAEELGL